MKCLINLFFVLSLGIGTAHAAIRGGQCKTSGGIFSWEYNDIPKKHNDIRMTGKMAGSNIIDFSLREDKSIHSLAWVTDNNTYYFDRGDDKKKSASL